MASKLRVIILKPSKYAPDGHVERFRWGFMPNSTVPHIRSMTPGEIGGVPIEVHTIDEYVHCDLDYYSLLRGERGCRTLLALVGVQSHQFHRALDLAAYARTNGCLAVIGGPHPMTCDTSMLQGRGVSFALAEAELIWPSILGDAATGELRPAYGLERRWEQELNAPVVIPPGRRDLRRYIVPMLGLYPARGCPFVCNYCSVIQIAGRRVRGQRIETTIESLRAAKAAGVKTIMFTSDNFNKYDKARELLDAIIEERLGLSYFVQCDTQIARQEELVALLARAGCYQMFVGVESFNRSTLLAARKGQNRPELYREIVDLCRSYGISSHFSNIIGFPDDTESGIRDHVAALCDLSPSCASFYILCPIPGTEQYDDFLRENLIVENNLDRFDTTCLTWRHPHLSPGELLRLLFWSYKVFFSIKHAAANAYHLSRDHGNYLSNSLASFANALFNRHSARRATHPMSGGVKRVVLDTANGLLRFRREVFGYELVPLPQNLQLPMTDRLSDGKRTKTNDPNASRR
jgi:hypothetical protein